MYDLEILRKYGRILIEIAGYAVNGKIYDGFEKIKEWDFLIQLADKHSITNLIAYAISDKTTAPKEVVEYINQSKTRNIYIETHQEIAVGKLTDLFEEYSVKYMLLKGYYMKQLYPSMDMRSMSDIDILISKEQEPIVLKILAENGYKVVSNKLDELKIFIEPIVNIEIHKMLIENDWKRFYDYYGTGWKFAKHCDSLSYRYVMTDEDFYVFHIVHMIRHYIFAGVGIRPFLDVYIFLENKKDVLNWEYINNQFITLEIEEFAQNISQLAYMWFGDGKRNSVLDEMELYVIASGIYGNVYNRLLRETIHHKKNIIAYYLKQLFPSKIKMSSQFDMVRKYPITLPLFWGVRIFQGIMCKKNKENARRIIKQHENVSDENVEWLIDHYKKIGANDII